MKKLLSLAAAVIALSLVYSAPAQAAVLLKFAGQYALQHPSTILMQELADSVKERTNGEVDIRVFPANQLGDYTQVYEEVRRGTIEMALISIPGQFDYRLEAAVMPYIATDYEEAKRVYARGSTMFKIMDESHTTLGVKFLGFNVEGFGGLGGIKLPENLDQPEAKRNFILRIPPMATWQIVGEDHGFQTVTIPFAELYTSLQTGVAEGWYGGPPNDNWYGFRDVIKVFVVCNNFFANTGYIMHQATFDKLSPEHQKVISEEAIRIGEKSFGIAQEEEEGYLKKMEEYGIQVVRFTPEQLKAWADYTRKVSWPKMEDRLTKPVIDAMLSEYK